MQCTNCGANLPPGAISCPLCGLPTPYNATGSADSPQIAPTVIAPYGSPPPIDPTVAIPPLRAMPPTGYGAPAYGTPPPPVPNPYDPNSVNPYNAPTSPFEVPPQYGAPPMQQGGYVPPPQVGPGGYGYGAPPPKRRSRVGLIVGIVLFVILLACVGISVLVYQGAKLGINTVTATATAAAGTATSIPTAETTTSGQGTPPSGQAIDATAANIINNIQTASDIDQNTAIPTKLATTFTTQQTIYTTVNLNLNGQTGFAEARWYDGNTLLHTSKILNLNDPKFAHAYFGFIYSNATQGAVEIYWCTQSDCSDAALAGATNFTVTSSSFHWQGPSPVAFIDSNRPYVAGLR